MLKTYIELEYTDNAAREPIATGQNKTYRLWKEWVHYDIPALLQSR
jgi:hypothetical protein